MFNKLKNIIKNSSIFKHYCDWKIDRQEFTRFLAELPPPEKFQQLSDYLGVRRDYIKALKLHRVTWSEYYHQYEFDKLPETERKKFVSRSKAQKMYRHLVRKDIRSLMYDKEKFLLVFQKYIHRHWLHLSQEDGATIEEFRTLLKSSDCIIKPVSGSLGNGIRKISTKSVSNIETLYAELSHENVLVEECLTATDEIQSFNPDSLNTIRVVTISKKPKAIVFGAFIRMGRKGTIVDNAHAGGIFAQINVDSGIIESSGITTDGQKYEVHPDSGKQIVGFKIPYWEEIKKTCLEAALSIDNLYFAGWDVCIRLDGKIEFIEGNHGPDFDVMQSPLKVGVKEKLNKITEEYFGYTIT